MGGLTLLRQLIREWEILHEHITYSEKEITFHGLAGNQFSLDFHPEFSTTLAETLTMSYVISPIELPWTVLGIASLFDWALLSTHVTNPTSRMPTETRLKEIRLSRHIQMGMYHLCPLSQHHLKLPTLPHKTSSYMEWLGLKEESHGRRRLSASYRVTKAVCPRHWGVFSSIPAHRASSHWSFLGVIFLSRGWQGCILGLGEENFMVSDHHGHHSLDLRSPWKKEERDL